MSLPSTPRRANECTRVIRPVPVLAEPSWPAGRIFQRHFEPLRALYDRAAPGYVVASVFGNQELCGAGAIGVGGHAVVGRHGEADVLLRSDAAVALRHVLITVRDSEVGPCARVLDLRTGLPFLLDTGQSCEAAVTDGDMFLQIGHHALLVLKVLGCDRPWGDDAGRVWRERPRSEVVDQRLAPAGGVVALGPEARGQWCEERVSRVRLVPGVVQSRPLADPDHPPPDIVATVGFVQEGRVEVVCGLTAAALRRGVLLGRYLRCELTLRGLASDALVSRVHALLLGDDDRVRVIDTASTNGIIVDGERARAAELGQRNLIELATGNRLWWQWLGTGRPGLAEVGGPMSAGSGPHG